MREVEEAGELAAGAAEPGDGALLADGHTAESACLNCATPLAGAYCHACGQRGHIHRTLSAFFHDLLHSVFHFDGKLWNTLPLLLWRPGELTRSYIDGQRARFVSPMALFLFSVFLMFTALSLTESRDGVTASADVVAEKARVEQRLTVLDRRLRGASPSLTADLLEERSELRAELRGYEALVAIGDGRVAKRGGAERADPRITLLAPTGWKALDEAVEKAESNPSLLFYKLRTNAYKWSWALIPLSVPFLWLLFPFSRRFRLYDHTVFVTYSLCFMTLLVVVTMLLVEVGLPGAAAVATLVPPIHMYRQLKGTYGLGRPGALVRAALLSLFAMTAASFFVMMIVGLGLFD